MDICRSFYLASPPNDFTELAIDANRLDFNNIAFVPPVNDNLLTKQRLSARCGCLLRRVIALHGPQRPD